ncbi:MAG: hypothetical protein NC548_33700 [Lachnospiraceae bacterium]|nr:hypothetical protein [Lachnospiraceae bacterium]MCM1236270.1 hypothetical protein [Ruminococcus flavefaciens]
MPAVKEYLNRLKESESKLMEHPMHGIFLEMDWLSNNITMALEGADSLRKKAASMPDCMEKGYALRAVRQAAESLDAVHEHFVKAESIVEKGVEDAVEKARKGGAVPKRSFSLPAVIAELGKITGGLEISAREVEKCIRAIEVSGGLRCENGHYIATDGVKLHDGISNKPDLPALLWSMRELVQEIGQIDRAAEIAVGRVNAARQSRNPVKTHTVISVKKADIQEKKTSLRGKLTENKIASREQYDAHSRKKGHKEHSMQI